MNHYLTLIALASCLALASCAHRPVEEPRMTQALDEVRSAYQAGQYAEVTRIVGLSVDLQTAPPALHTEALKLQAFSYCLLNDAVRCRRSFDRLLKRYPAFDLAAAESRHPMWGPVFQQAKNEAGS